MNHPKNTQNEVQIKKKNKMLYVLNVNKTLENYIYHKFYI